MPKKIQTLYFSATGTTEKIVNGIAEKYVEKFGKKIIVDPIDVTLPEARKKAYAFDKNTLVIAGVPVYAGRVPNVLLKFLNTLSGNGAMAVAVVLYGNRHYDDGLIEFKDILEADGFEVIAGGAFIGEHSFSKTLASNRPDDKDMAVAAAFAGKIVDKIIRSEDISSVAVNGTQPYRDYYRPKDPDGNPVSILKVTPITNSDCTDCKRCAEVCPMGSIDTDDVTRLTGICIKCGACIKKCPVAAKYFDDENYLRHKHELEEEFGSVRREPECFV